MLPDGPLSGNYRLLRRAVLAPDLLVYGQGTVYLLHAASPRGSDWITEHIAANAQRLGTAVAVEHHYIADIVRGAVADGLRVR